MRKKRVNKDAIQVCSSTTTATAVCVNDALCDCLTGLIMA